MSLRRQSLSPTANLLRHSRLFALPNPLPRPLVAESFGAGNLKASDTATLPYPTHQAIASTPSSRARGDWGLKRPLPARSRILKKSNPVVRVTQWDSIEEITDFDSAADHVRTRQKFEEMGVPVLKGMSHFAETDLSAPPPKSAFEADADVTAYDVQEGLDGAGMALQALRESIKNTTRIARMKRDAARSPEAAQEIGPVPENTYTPPTVPPHAAQLPNLRWKHDGPWLPGMGAEEFEAYLTKELAGRKKEFNWYLVNYVKGQLYASRSSLSRRTETPPMDQSEAEAWEAAKQKEWTHFTRADIARGIQALREKCAADPLNSDLVQKLIIPFLRLPPMKLKSTRYASSSYNQGVDSQRFADETTPNSTHPSAGLGYLRTKAYLANHPVLGPQALPSPVTARVIQPRVTKTRKENSARLGIAGFVTNDEFRDSTGRGSWNQAGDMLDVETEGGAKVTVQPLFAAVSPEGKVHIKVKRSYGPELQVSRGQLEDKPPVRENVEKRPLDSSSLTGLAAGAGTEKEMKMEDFHKLLESAEKSFAARKTE